MTPKDVKQKRKVSAPAAESAGASCGSVTSRARRQRPGAEHGGRLGAAPVDRRPGAADDPRHDRDVEVDVRGENRRHSVLPPGGQQLEERRRDDHRRQHERDEHECARERAAAKAEPSERPRERQSRREREHGRGGRLPDGEPDERAGPGRAGTGPRRDVSPRSRIVTSGKTKKNARNARGTTAAAAVPRRVSAGRRVSIRRSSGRGCDRSRPRGAAAALRGRRRSGGTRPGAAFRPARAARTCCRGATPGSARRA